jgi:hypothetical protein
MNAFEPGARFMRGEGLHRWADAFDLRCEYDQRGECVAVNPCHGDYRQDKCLARVEGRTWCSPIYLD